jgi:ankyrin repeat protein
LLAGARVGAEDEGGKQVLIYVAEGGSAELVRLLIAHGANVNAEPKRVGIKCADAAEAPDCRAFVLTHGMTPLMVAAQSGNIEIVQVLLEAGADPTRKDPEARLRVSSPRNSGTMMLRECWFSRPPHGSAPGAASADSA